MHARVITVQSTPSDMERAIDTYKSSVIPEASKMPGFKNAFLLAEAATGQAISIVLWETEADMIAGEDSEYLQNQITKFGAIFDAPPAIEHYEVRAFG